MDSNGCTKAVSLLRLEHTQLYHSSGHLMAGFGWKKDATLEYIWMIIQSFLIIINSLRTQSHQVMESRLTRIIYVT